MVNPSQKGASLILLDDLQGGGKGGGGNCLDLGGSGPGHGGLEGVEAQGAAGHLVHERRHPWKKRGKEYEQLKESISQRLLAELYKREPQLKGKVACYELSSPITTQHFMNYEKGELYGIDHNPERYKQRFLQPRTPIKNLYLTGQDIVTCGVAGALFAGFITASAILRKNILKPLLKNKKSKAA